jgi:ketosteroid isomerase-like protein
MTQVLQYYRVLKTSFVACFCVLFVGCASVPTKQTTEQYIKESERQWAESVVSGDASALERILADDYLGVDTSGNLTTKEQEIAGTRNGKGEYISCHLNEVKVRFYGNTAVAQGSESWVRRTGEPRQGRFVWTDTWVCRNGRWQIVAAEDLALQRQFPQNRMIEGE